MPGKIKVKVLAGRNLPVMDRASDTTDAFVEIKFGGVTHKTDVCRKSLNPHWNNTEWYRFEVDESELQDEPLQLRLMDHDTYSANDAIGKVVISLAPLLAREANNVKGTAGPPGGAVMSGWIPVFDTMHGIRGELNVIVKVELFSDFNKYKTSSCGVQFFHCPSIPPGYRATSVHGFVEELVVNDDPEYQWIDKIRTPRASNEARQVAFIKLSNQVQRLVGLKAAELGANAVVGYQQEFDLEGEAGVVARAIGKPRDMTSGTAVSITPLPTPSQPMNIPPCTQQQLKKCLDILATDDDSVTDLSQYYQTHQEELQKMLSILNPNAPSMLDEPEAADDDDDKLETARLSIHSFTGSMSLFQDDQIHHRSLKHLSDDQTDLNKLLSRKGEDDDSDSSGPIQKIKKLKTNFFTKRFSKRKRDKKEKQDDQISIKSNTSDTSRISLVEIKNELKKRFKKPKIRKTFTNPDDEGVGMASILARSVIHAHTSLACITETQDSEHSAQETARRTSESETNKNASDEDKPRKISLEKLAEIKGEMEGKTVPDIHFSSLKNMSSEDAVPERVRKISESCPSSPMVGRSENLLKLPGDKGYYGSVSSALSGESSEVSSSSEEDDESSDVKTDSEESVETTASIVNSVLNHEKNLIAQMERKLTILENVHPPLTEIIPPDVELKEQTKEASQPLEEETKQVDNNTEILEKDTNTFVIEQPQEKIEINVPSTSAQNIDKCVQKPDMHHIKIHNPFAHKKTSKSFSAPSSPTEKNSFVHRSSKRIKHQLAKLSKSTMIKSISHLSLLPKKKGDSKTPSQRGSSSNVPSRTPSDTVLGSLFLSYSDLLSLDKERLQSLHVNRGICKSDEIGHSNVSMYIGSEPVSRTSLSGPSFPSHHKEDHHRKEKPSLKPVGLIHTAMETILIDKVDTILCPTSPDPISNNKQFFDDVSEKLEEHKNRASSTLGMMGQVQLSTGSTTPRVVAMTPKRLSDDLTSQAFKVQDSRNSISESKGLIHTAMETILMDKANAILPETPESTYQMKGSSHDIREKSKTKDHKFLDSVKSSLKEHHVNLDSIFGKHHVKKENSPDIKTEGLIHTAMQTMLMDRAQSMIPDTPEPIPIRSEPVFERVCRSRKASETQESVGLIHSAMQTILMDKIQAVLPNTSEPVPVHIDNTDTKSLKSDNSRTEESSGMVHSAMQTILMDKIQAVLPNTSEPVPVHIDDSDTKSLTDNSRTEESGGMVHSAMQTILIDKIQAVLPDTSEPIPVHLDNTDTEPVKEGTHTEEGSSGLIHSAMETILMDKVQTVLPDVTEPIPVHLGNTDTNSVNESKKIEKFSGNIDSAMQNKVQTVYPNSTDLNLMTDVSVESVENKLLEKPDEESRMVNTAMQTILLDKIQSFVGTPRHIPVERKPIATADLKSPGLVGTAMQTILMDKRKSAVATKIRENVDSSTAESSNIPIDTKSEETQCENKNKVEAKCKKLIRQDSVHSISDAKDSHKMSNEHLSNMSPSNVTRPPVLQHHPILSGLETIPSMSESSFERSLDGESSFETNSASVCDNSHAACGFGRSERDRDRSERDKGSPRHSRHESYGGKDPVGSAQAQASLNSTSTPMGIHRRSSDSDLSVTPKGGSLNTSAGNVGSGGGAILRPSMNTDNLDMLEYPFLTMTEYPPGFIVHIVSSALSGESSEVSSSSEEDDESSDVKTDSEESVETTASIVNSVLNHEKNLIAQMERKLTILENVHPPLTEIIPPDVELKEQTKEASQPLEEETKQVDNNTEILEKDTNTFVIEQPQEKIEINVPSTSAQNIDKCVQKPDMHHIKIHNPFAHKKTSKSFSAPSSPTEKNSFVHRSSKRIKHQLAKLSKSTMIKSISHLSLLPKKKGDSKTPSQRGSSSNVPSRTPSDTVLGSLFLSYSDLLSLDKERLQSLHVNRGICKSDEIGHSNVSMYIGSEPVSRTSLSGPSFPSHHKEDHHRKEKPSLKPVGLIHTAMETILIDKVDTILCPTSPDPISNNKQFFDDVSEKLEEHKNRASSTLGMMGQVQLSTGSTTPRVVAMTPKRLSDDLTSQAFKVQDSRNSISESKGLIHTAMETILMDKANAILPETPESTYQMKGSSHDIREKSKTKDHKFLDSVKSSLKEHHVNLDSIFGKHHVKKENSPDIKTEGLIHTAMQTMLMDRAQSMIPDTPEPIPIRSEPVFERVCRSRKASETQESVGLIHSAMQTILMDKIQAVLPNTSEPVPVHIDNTDTKSLKSDNSRTEESSGMVHSAMQTILMDKIQAVLPNTSEPVPVHIDDSDTKSLTDNSRTEESGGMVHSAMQTILIDKIQAVLPDTSEPIPVHLDNTDTEPVKEGTHTEEGSSGLIHSAMETILMDKVQTVLPDVTEPIPVHLGNTDTNSVNESKKIEKFSGNIDSAMQNKVQTVYPNSTDLNLMTDVSVESVENKLLEKPDEESRMVNTAMQTILLDKIQSFVGTPRHIPVERKPIATADLKSPGLVGTAMQTILMDKRKSAVATKIRENVDSSTAESSNIPIDTKSEETQCENKNKVEAKCKKLIRQDSVHSISDAKDSHKMSNEHLSNMSPSNVTRPPVLQHHPILSGLETIPSMSESSFERSLDGESSFETNSASVCDNSHAACGFGRSERDRDRSERDKGSPRHSRHESYGGKDPVGSAQAQASLNSTSTPMGIHRRSSDSDLSVTPKGGSLNTSAGNVGSGGGAILRPSMNTDNLDMLEYPFLTMTEYPPGFIVHIGGTVCARSVKLVDGGGESAARAAWWAELRTELRAHARALRCTAVLAYTDTCSICEDVCVLSASGTAAVINLDCDYNVDIDAPITGASQAAPCSAAHVPYSPGAGPYRAELAPCALCRRARVPTVLLATCAKPSKLMAYSKAVTLTAVAARVRRAAASAEPGARDLSDQLPFLEYELHKLLLAKLRMQGANALFELRTQIAIGERCVMALASGAACKLAALPPPAPPRIKATDNDKDALEMQRKLWDSFTANKTDNGYDIAPPGVEHATAGSVPEMDREDLPALDLCADKDACVLELDEAEDVERARALCVRRARPSAYCGGPAACAPPHAFAQVSRGRLPAAPRDAPGAAERHVERALDAVTYKLRRLRPAALAAHYHLELPEDEIQLMVSGTAIPLIDPGKGDSNGASENGNTGNISTSVHSSHNGSGSGDDDIFTLDEEQLVKSQPQEVVVEDKNGFTGQVPTSVCVTTLSAVHGASVSRRVCALRLLFVRETTAVRELGGLSGFLHTFTCEVLAIARAYTAALGGNALTSFYIRQLMLQDNAHKNQGQCLMSIGGDIVHITY